MEKLHKNERDVLLSKSKKGNRPFLCSNKMSCRLPFFDSNTNFQPKEVCEADESLTDEQLQKVQELMDKFAKLFLKCWLNEINNNELQ